MNSDHLVFLAEILDAGNLSAAGRRFKTSRANVSYRLKMIEKTLGQKLVRRTTRRIEPTDVGLRLYEHGVKIRSELASAKDTLDELGNTLSGRIRLSIPSGYGQVIMATWLLDFKKNYPGIVLDVTFENHIQNMLRDEVDLSVRIMSNPPQSLVARHLGAVRYIACASKEYADKNGLPVCLDELPKAPIITSTVANRKLRLSAYKNQIREEVMLEPTLVSENFIFMRDAILNGVGIGIVPDYLMSNEIEKGQVVTTLDEWNMSIFGTEIFLLYMPNIYHTKATSVFIEYLLDRTQQERKNV